MNTSMPHTPDQAREEYKKLITLLTEGEWLDRGHVDAHVMSPKNWAVWGSARMTQKGKVILVAKGEVTTHDNSSGDRWQTQAGVGENGKNYERKRPLPSWDDVRSNHGARQEKYLLERPDAEWSAWYLA